jgi:hypothetical protein
MYENRTTKPIKIVKQYRGRRDIRKSNREGKYDQSALYACGEYHNETPFLQLISLIKNKVDLTGKKMQPLSYLLNLVYQIVRKQTLKTRLILR